MGKKILVITGSPRKKGNSFAMTDAFVNAAEAKGHTVTRFDAAFMNVGGCRACDTCFQTGRACSFDDDFNTIAPEIEAADAIVFTSPVYWYTFSAQIKAVMDKLYAFMTVEKDIANKKHGFARKGIGGKKYGLISCYEENDMSVMDGVRFSYERTVTMLKGTSVGEVLIPNVWDVNDIQKTEGIEQAKALAEKF
ncbi:flavodoxin family protein [Clostridium sp. MSJ-11]|uniref:Flavodoxin family protein n=1 Tax=Clostridium mobile TaxID=2841512 RepID=A0ABS6EDT2_9CLOT|nr:flavodoxin family protein [Clostridium mobile]MBU5483361.1 flavodoxin family protein [Clostridium mobile]